MIAQLTLVVYMFIAKEDYLKHMEHVVDRAWDRRTQKADYMDGLQIGVSCCILLIVFTRFFMCIFHSLNAVATETTEITLIKDSCQQLAVKTPTVVPWKPPIRTDVSRLLFASGIKTVISSSMLDSSLLLSRWVFCSLFLYRNFVKPFSLSVCWLHLLMLLGKQHS